MGLAAMNAEFERLRLGAIAGGKETHVAILKHLAAFKTSKHSGVSIREWEKDEMTKGREYNVYTEDGWSDS